MISFCDSKINVGLDIVARRDDGYHDIVTAMVPIAWGDILEIVPAKGGDTTLTVSGRAIDCPVEKNLVMKAYRALALVAELPQVDIYLRKIVPDGAGLGGGSSDAAHTLLTLNKLFDLGLSLDRLADIASTIGADCPFFIYGKPMMATGTGTTLSPVDLDLSAWKAVVVKPPVSVPTAKAYSGVTPAMPATPLCRLLELPVKQWQGRVKNDFEASIFPGYPLVEEVKRQMLAMGATYASMSGSGSAVYGLFAADADLSMPAAWRCEGWACWTSESPAGE
jgi:4-diphosphocytidyl-2-C-methyl-D-erythritol kinase